MNFCKPQAILVLTAALFGLPTGAFAQGVKDRSCYGDTIEVMLVNEITGEPKIPLSIPLDAFPVIYGYPDNADGSPPDPSRGCFKEPVLARTVYFYPNSGPAAVLGIPETGPYVRRFKI